MDYRYYRGDPPEFISGLIKHLHWLRYIGSLMILSAPMIGFLVLLGILESSLILFMVGFMFGIFGNIFVIIGISYNTIMDRSKSKCKKN